MISRDPALFWALTQWQRAAGPYWPYVCAAPFLSDVSPVQRARMRPSGLGVTLSLRALLESADGVAVFVDNPLAQTLAATPQLNALGLLVVPVVQRWCTKPAVLPSQRLVDLLAAYAKLALTPPEARGVAFLLDSERRGPVPQAARLVSHPAHRAFDNRYRYSPDRFPSCDVLKRHGVTVVGWVATGDVADDMRPYVQELAAAGLAPYAMGASLLTS